MSPVRKPKPTPRPIVVRAVYRPRPAVRERLVDLLVELLDQERRSGRG